MVRVAVIDVGTVTARLALADVDGGKVIRCSDRKVIRDQLIDKPVAVKMIRFALENDLQLHICSGLSWQVTKMSESTLAYAKKIISRAQEAGVDVEEN